MKLRIIEGALLVALIAGCGAEGSFPEPGTLGEELEFSVIECSALSTASLVEEGCQVINDSHRFAEVFLATDLNSQQETPEINFDKYSVVALHLGEQPSFGYQVRVINIAEIASTVSVNFEVTSPSVGCAVDGAITFPYCFVSVEKKRSNLRLVRAKNGNA